MRALISSKTYGTAEAVPSPNRSEDFSATCEAMPSQGPQRLKAG